MYVLGIRTVRGVDPFVHPTARIFTPARHTKYLAAHQTSAARSGGSVAMARFIFSNVGFDASVSSRSLLPLVAEYQHPN